MLDFWRNWTMMRHRPAARRRPAAARIGHDPEGLESRCLLSASRGHRAAEVAVDASTESDQKAAREPRGARKVTVPSIAGTTWELFTDPGGSNIHGVLELQQRGKRIFGTLTNDLQPEGSFKVRLKMTRDRDIGWTFTGTCLNRSVSSIACKVTGTAADQNPSDGMNGIDYLEGRFTPRRADGEPADFTATTVFNT